MDVIDQAIELVGKIEDNALKKNRIKLLSKGSLECIECGEPIPKARRKAYPAAIRCINCQIKAESRRGR